MAKEPITSRKAVPDAGRDAEPAAGQGAEPGAAAIARVADELLPSLIARFTQSELGEMEVGQEGWRIRLRRDVGAAAGGPARTQVGHQGAGTHSGGGRDHGGGGHGTAAASASGSPATTTNRSSVVRRTALSPAVGYFTARDGLATGQAVRSGDVLGVIDVLGVTQPVIAPSDGVIGRILATVGEAVEYGQELVRIDGIERLVES